MNHDSRTDSTRPAGPLPDACARFRGRLSGYLDGTLPEAAGLEADAHVAACDPCRHLADETEASERTLSELVSDDAGAGLPEGFAGSIIARTVHAGPTPGPAAVESRTAAPTAWLGWLAAAAAVTFSVVTLNVDRPGPTNESLVPVAAVASVRSQPWAVSTVLDPLTANEPAVSETAAVRDLQPLHAAALLLDGLAQGTPDMATFVAEAVAYDDLIPRLTALAETSPPGDDAAETIRRAARILDRAGRGPVEAPEELGRLAGALVRLEAASGG